MDDAEQYAQDAVVNQGSNILASISNVAREIKLAEAEVVDKETDLKAAKEKLRELSEDVLPKLMEAAEQSKLTTRDGLDVVVKDVLQISMTDDRKPYAYKWLKENGQAAVVKRKFITEFDRLEIDDADEFRTLMKGEDVRFKEEESVHHQTLLATLRELLAQGVDVPLDKFGGFIRTVAAVK